MLDIETLGNGSDALILSLAAVEFFPSAHEADQIGRNIHYFIDPQSAARYGKIDVSTVLWWMQQSDAARDMITSKGIERFTLPQALRNLREFVADGWVEGVWGNGATFDNVILSNAARACGQNPLWSFRADRDFRTLRWMTETLYLQVPDPDYEGTAHDALSDATWQAMKACMMIRAVKQRGEKCNS